MAWWGGEARHALYNKITDLYQQRNPGITIVREYAGWDDYWIKTATQAASKNVPDITASVIDTLSEYALREAYLPLDEFTAAGIIDISDWPKSVLDGVTIDGKLYMMPTGTTINTVVVNADMIKKAGMEPPPMEMTYDDYRNYAVELKSKLGDDVWATGEGVMTAEHFQSWVLQSGYQIANEDGTDVGFPKEVLVSFLNYWKELYDSGAVLPIDFTAQPLSDAWAESWIAKGKVAMTWTNSNQLKIYQQYTEGDLVLIRNPTMPAGKNKYGEYLRPSGLSIAANSRAPQEVAKFINFFVNDVEAIKIFNAELGAVAPEHGQEALEASMHPKDKLVHEYFNTITTTPGLPSKMPDPKGTPAVLTAFRRAGESIRYDTSVEAAADTFMKEAADAYKAASA